MCRIPKEICKYLVYIPKYSIETTKYHGIRANSLIHCHDDGVSIGRESRTNLDLMPKKQRTERAYLLVGKISANDTTASLTR